MSAARALLPFAVTALACSSAPSGRCNTLGFGGAYSPAPFGAIGARSVVRVYAGATCLQSGETLTAQAGVVGPDGNGVDATVIALGEENLGVYADLEFTPRVYGTHHVSVRFRPNIVLAQLDVFVGEDRRDAGTAFIIDGRAGLSACRQFDVLPSGEVLCTFPNVALYGSDGGLQQTLTEGTAARANGVLWATTESELQRWEQRPNGRWERTPDAGISHYDGPVFGTGSNLLASETDLVTRYKYVWLTDAGTLDAKLLSYPGAPLDNAWRSGDDVFYVSYYNACRVPATAVDTEVGQGCRDGGVRSALQLGTDRHGIWTFEPAATFGGPAVATLGLSAPDVEARVALPPNLELPHMQEVRWDTSPIFAAPADGGLWAPALRNGALAFERYRDDLSLLAFSTDWAVFTDSKSQLHFVRR